MYAMARRHHDHIRRRAFDDQIPNDRREPGQLGAVSAYRRDEWVQRGPVSCLLDRASGEHVVGRHEYVAATHESLLLSQVMTNHPNDQIQPKSTCKVEAIPPLGGTAPGSQDIARNAQLVPKNCVSSYTLPTRRGTPVPFSLSLLQNLDVKILVALNLLSRGGHS